MDTVHRLQVGHTLCEGVCECVCVGGGEKINTTAGSSGGRKLDMLQHSRNSQEGDINLRGWGGKCLCCPLNKINPIDVYIIEGGS